MSDNIVCKACNASNPAEATFCVDCGTNFNLPKLKQNVTEFSIEPSKLDKMMKLLEYLDEWEHIKIELDKQQEMVKNIKSELEKAEKEIDQLNQKLKSETADVEDLQNFTFVKMIAKIKGDHKEQLSKEQEEVAQVNEKLDVAIENYNNIEKQFTNATEELEQIKELNDNYNNVKQELNGLMEEVYKGTTHPEEDRIEQELSEVSNEFYRLKKTIYDQNLALDYLLSAKSNLREAQSQLSSAGTYASWDAFFDGGLLVDSMKHKRWKTARSYMKKANRDIHMAEKYLTDGVGIRVDTERSGSDFFDVWMDNIFSDFRARSEINQSKTQVNRVVHEVRQTISEVKSAKRELDNQFQELETRKNSLQKDLRGKRIQLLKDYSQSKSVKLKSE